MIPRGPVLRLLRQVPGWRLPLLPLLLLLASITDGFGLLMLVPMLELLQADGQTQGQVTRYVAAALEAVGLPVSLEVLLVIFVVLAVVRAGLSHARDMFSAAVQNRIVDDLRKRCFAAILRAEWRWVAAGRRSDHANLLLTEVNRTGMAFVSLVSLLGSLATLAACIVAAFALSWQASLLALVCTGAVFWVVVGLRGKAFGLGEDLGTANRALQNATQETLQGLKIAKILRSEDRHVERFNNATRSLRRRQMAFHAEASMARAGFQVGGAVLLAACLYVGAVVLKTGLAELLTLVVVFSRLVPLASGLQQQHARLLHSLPAAIEIDRLLADAANVSELDVAAEGSVPWPIGAGIVLDGVVVRHPGRDRAALDGVSLTLAPGTTTVITGPSGAGKSTLADVLTGLIVPDEGRMSVDGVPVADGARARWRLSVACVPQDSFLFHDTVRANLLWARPDADDAAMERALRGAAADFILALPQGIDTVVGDGGARLSGGERQRVALARALLVNPSLVILDEVTSALDPASESRVHEVVAALSGQLTLVVITHRPPASIGADRVVTLRDGRVV